MALREAAVVDIRPSDGLSELDSRHATHRIRLWDLPIRVFHWSLLASVSTAIATGLLGGDWMPVHGKAGIAIVGLLTFRLVWGFVGPTPVRFTHFTPSPDRIVAYLKGQWQGVGHNPLGALSVFALLGLLSFQAITGLLGNDDIAFTGPLAQLVSDEWSHTLTNWHHQAIKLLYGLLALHVAAIVFYTHVKKDKLVPPMVTGWKDVPTNIPAPPRTRRIGVIAAVVTALLGVYAASGSWIATNAPATPATESAHPAQPSAVSGGEKTDASGESAAKVAPAW